VTSRPVIDGRQHRTPATRPEAFHEEPGLILSRGRQSIRGRIWHTPNISHKFAGE